MAVLRIIGVIVAVFLLYVVVFGPIYRKLFYAARGAWRIHKMRRDRF